MSSFEPCNRWFERESIDGIWRKDRFDAFAKDFNLKSAMYTSSVYICDHAGYFVRFLLSVGRKPVRKRAEALHCGNEYNMDRYWRLFDHSAAFKTNNGVHFIVSMPYGSQETIIDEFRKLQSDYPCTRSVDMYFIDNKYKYRKNGNCMVMFVAWPAGKLEKFNRSAMSKNFHLDVWSELSHPNAMQSYDNLYANGFL